jgi:hypothetical protein
MEKATGKEDQREIGQICQTFLVLLINNDLNYLYEHLIKLNNPWKLLAYFNSD